MAFFVAFLAVQISVPTLALFEARPARFGWQMFSGARTRADFVIVEVSGAQREVELADYLGNPRSEIDLEAVLPPYICAVEPGAGAVRINPWDEDKATTEVRCAR